MGANRKELADVAARGCDHVTATLAIIFLLLFLNFGNVAETLLVMLALPFPLVGGILLMWLLGYHWSVAAASGFIALAGVAAETGVVMLIYLDHAWAARRPEETGWRLLPISIWLSWKAQLGGYGP